MSAGFGSRRSFESSLSANGYMADGHGMSGCRAVPAAAQDMTHDGNRNLNARPHLPFGLLGSLTQSPKP